jgi:hypothetical protein
MEPISPTGVEEGETASSSDSAGRRGRDNFLFRLSRVLEKILKTCPLLGLVARNRFSGRFLTKHTILLFTKLLEIFSLVMMV